MHLPHSLQEYLFECQIPAVRPFLRPSHVVFAVNGQEVPVKLRTSIGDCLELSFGNLRRWSVAEVNTLRLVAYLAVVLELSKCGSSLAGIPNLSAIPRTKLVSLVAMEQFFHPLHHLLLLESDPALPGYFDSLEIDAPDFQSLLFIKLLVIQGDMDARLEGFIESPDLVCCQEKYARVVLQHAEKDRYDCISGEVAVSGTRLQEHIGFIQQHDTAPSMCQLETFVQAFLNVTRIVADVT